MSTKEIANELQMSEGAVRQLLLRGLRKLAAEGEAENFRAVVRAWEFKRGERSIIRCGSIECRSDKRIYAKE
jgi:orotate phosphoribosyltransferase-like protein